MSAKDARIQNGDDAAARSQEPSGLTKGLRAKSRWTDPDTSRAAARRVESDGSAIGQRRACLDEVRKHPGKTAAEIAEAVGLERHVPSRRLPELRHASLVRNGPSRVCEIMGTRAMTWIPEDQAVAPLMQGRLF